MVVKMHSELIAFSQPSTCPSANQGGTTARQAEHVTYKLTALIPYDICAISVFYHNASFSTFQCLILFIVIIIVVVVAVVIVAVSYLVVVSTHTCSCITKKWDVPQSSHGLTPKVSSIGVHFPNHLEFCFGDIAYQHMKEAS